MARRASSSFNPLLLVGVLVLVVAALAGGWFLFDRLRDPYRTLTPLDVAAYLDNANSLRGNVYKISATVQTQLAWSATAGRLYSMETENGGNLLPVLIPAEFNSMNIQKGQRYYLQIKVEDKGILKAQGIRKV
jgi:hypothetical protein